MRVYWEVRMAGAKQSRACLGGGRSREEQVAEAAAHTASQAS